MELNLRFPNVNQVIVRFNDVDTDTIDFELPITAEDQQDIHWYLEVYGPSYTTEVDDARAERIANKLPQWGADLFKAVFKEHSAQQLFFAFKNKKKKGRLLTISASHPAILSLPWELLCVPQATYLFHSEPRISIRRRFAGAGAGQEPFQVKKKKRLQLLFVVSRPSGAGFIDPRGEAIAVLDAIQQEAAGRVEVEFLRPATLDNLKARLEQRLGHKHKPPIDIVHFDGHGKYEDDVNKGYLLFEDKDGKIDEITAESLGNTLNEKQVGLIVLSACQSAAMDGEEAIGSVAARLTHAGIPTVLAMTHSVLVTTARQLFSQFYQGLMSGEGTGEALDNARRDLYLNQNRGERQRGDQRVILKLQDWFLPALYQAGKDTPLLRNDLTPRPPSLRGKGEEEGGGESDSNSNSCPPLLAGRDYSF